MRAADAGRNAASRSDVNSQVAEKTNAIDSKRSITYCLVPGLVSAQSAKQKAVIEQEIRKLDLVHADAVLRGDLAALDELWTEDFKVNNPFNEIDKADRIRVAGEDFSEAAWSAVRELRPNRSRNVSCVLVLLRVLPAEG